MSRKQRQAPSLPTRTVSVGKNPVRKKRLPARGVG